MTIMRQYVVTVTAETIEQADQVIAERIGPDEDYGFEYKIEQYAAGWLHATLSTMTLMDDWADDPSLSDAAKAALAGVSEETLDEVLVGLMAGYEDEWFSFFDNVRSDATDALLNKLGMERG